MMQIPSDFERWITQAFRFRDAAPGEIREKLVIEKIDHPTILTHEQAALLVCHIVNWLGDSALKATFSEHRQSRLTDCEQQQIDTTKHLRGEKTDKLATASKPYENWLVTCQACNGTGRVLAPDPKPAFLIKLPE